MYTQETKSSILTFELDNKPTISFLGPFKYEWPPMELDENGWPLPGVMEP